MNSTNPTNPNIRLIDPFQDPRWDKFVQSHPFGWICHLSGWKKVLENSFKHIKGYYYVLLDDKGETIKAGLPIYYVKSWLTGRRLVSIPFATLCDPLINSNENMLVLFNTLLDLSNDLNASYIEIRTLNCGPIAYNDRLGTVDYFKHHYLLLDEEPERLKKRFHRTCVRQRISRALKSDLKMKKGKDHSDLKAYYHLHSMTRKRLGLPNHPYRFFKSIWEVFSDSNLIEILLAQKEEKVIAGMILFKFKDRVSAEFAASDDEYFSLSPNHYLFWEAIKLACEEGFKIFDFGRTSPNNKTLMDFKNRWGTEMISLKQLYYPAEISLMIGRNKNSWKYKLMSKICEKSPDALQELIGNFCYRHLG